MDSTVRPGDPAAPLASIWIERLATISKLRRRLITK